MPQGFFGVVLGSPVFPDPPGAQTLAGQFALMVASGVEGVRAGFDWSAAQPYQKWTDVPVSKRSRFASDGVDNVPTDFAPLDTLVAQTAAHDLPLLPVVMNAPSWDGDFSQGAVVSIPKTPGAYAAFCRALVLRYGPHGSFWKTYSGRSRPITTWQIWNEPNVPAFWPPQPFAPRYVALLRAARGSIRKADPRATIVLAGLANYSWAALRAIYRIRGARALFDVVGLHPYTRTPQGVITILQYGRDVMRAAGDGAKPMIADEISWPSSQGKTVHNTGYDFATTEAGQARAVSKVLPLLAADRARLGLIAVYYYTWASVEHQNGLAFDFAGLLKYIGIRFVRKPAYYAYRHVVLGLERCHAKGSAADICRAPY